MICAVAALTAPGAITVATVTGQEAERSFGQTVYVPVYSEIPFGTGRRTIRLSATLSVRNVDPVNPITVARADYYDATGQRIDAYLSEPRTIPPLGSIELVVTESDLRGGVSAAFLVEWSSDSAVHPPLLETIMLGTSGAQGISFVGQARVIEERRP